MGQALEEMNNAMTTVNSLEASLTQARRRARQLEAEQRAVCQDAYDKLSRGVKEVLPAYSRQLLAVEQQHRTQRAFVEYKQAHDAHLAAKAAVAELETRLMAASGAAVDGACFPRTMCSQFSRPFRPIWPVGLTRRRAGGRPAAEPVQRLGVASGADRVRQAEGGPHTRSGGPPAVHSAVGAEAGATHHQGACGASAAVHRGEAARRGVAGGERWAHNAGAFGAALFCTRMLPPTPLADTPCLWSQIEARLADAKGAYSAAMGRLDSISREIHDRRQEALAAPREDNTAAAEQANGSSATAVEAVMEGHGEPPARQENTDPLQ